MRNARQLGVLAPIAKEIFDTWPSIKDGDSTVVEDLANTTDPSKGSQMVGYKFNGTSSVARTVNTKLRDWVSLKDFGAVGNGIADDTIAIQNALNWASSNGITLYIPAGIYRLFTAVGIGSSSSYISKGMRIVGAGKGTTYFRWDASSSSAGMYFYMNDQTYSLQISDMSVQTYRQGVGVAIAAFWPDASGVSSPAAHIVNVEIGAPLGVQGWFQYGIELRNAYMSTIDNVVIRGTGAGTPNRRDMLRGISLSGTSTDVKIINTHIYFAFRGIHLQDFSEGANIAHCYIIWVTEGITGLDGSSAPGFFCSNSHIYAFGHGIFLVGRPQAMISNNLIYQDPTASVPTFTGIAIGTNSTHAAVSGNLVYAGSSGTPSRAAIQIDAPNCTVWGNNFIGTTVGVTVTGAGTSGYLSFGQR